MPIYAYRCEECGREWDEYRTVEGRHSARCECGEKGRIDWRKFGSRNVMFFTPYTYEDIDVYPIRVTSKKQLKKLCDERGLKAARLM